MTEVPKIVHDRLEAASRNRDERDRDERDRGEKDRSAPAPAHPDADLLTAFAEQTLLATERDGVFEHLALCGDCRDVVALALPALDAANANAAETETGRSTAMPARAKRGWLTSPDLSWLNLSGPGLRWAALTAGVVVVASVLLVRPGKLNQLISPSANPQVATQAPPVSGSQLATSEVPSPVLPSSRSSSTAAPLHQAEPGMMLARNTNESARVGKRSPSAAKAPAFGGSAGREANEPVEVAGAEPAATIESSATATLMARNESPAIEKAKPPLQTAGAGTNAGTNEQQETDTVIGSKPVESGARNVMSATRLAPAAGQIVGQPKVTWTIAAGVLQRSLDSGQSWQDALHADHPLLCQASLHQDVWTGGQAGTLFHSVDGGVSWLPVRPTIEGQPLSSDVTHIDLQGPAKIIFSASNNEIWSSSDGGKTWMKK
jgi:hypothetical protein